MKRFLAIADDLSGAAEIAGIGDRYGLPTRLIRHPINEVPPGLTVVDSDSRSMPPGDAARVVDEFVRPLRREHAHLIYKKTDSVLRGPVAEEIGALVAHFGHIGASLIPQNPSRGRTIEKGQYLIDGVPLDQTPFAHDPEYPAYTADAKSLLERNGTSTAEKIAIGDARTLDDIRRWSASRGRDYLRAGGADFFELILQQYDLVAKKPMEDRLMPGPCLFICGSASAYSRDLIARVRSRGVPILAIEQSLDRTPGAAQLLLNTLVESVVQTLRARPVANLMLEGGSTAAAVCRRMGWNDLDVCGELATGVVHLRARSQDLYIKPGSYPWPDAVWKEN
jgi:uncharacterized protein YgbK (DUF1537 family)